MKSSDSIAKLADALVRANLVILNPTKDKTARAGSYSYRYVALDTIVADLRPILQAHGLAVVQEAATEGVTTRIIHASGEWLEFSALSLPAGSDAQSWGSAITYARRYTYCAALGIAADEDDDGAKAKSKPKTSPTSATRSDGVTSAGVGDSSSPAAHAATKTEKLEQPAVAGDPPAEPEPSSGSAGEASGGAGIGSDASEAPGVPVPPEHVHGDWGPAAKDGWLLCGRLNAKGKPCGHAEKAERVSA